MAEKRAKYSVSEMEEMESDCEQAIHALERQLQRLRIHKANLSRMINSESGRVVKKMQERRERYLVGARDVIGDV